MTGASPEDASNSLTSSAGLLGTRQRLRYPAGQPVVFPVMRAAEPPDRSEDKHTDLAPVAGFPSVPGA